MEIRAIHQSKSEEHRYRMTNVWIKREGRRQIVAAHMAFVLDPKQAAALSGER